MFVIHIIRLYFKQSKLLHAALLPKHKNKNGNIYEKSNFGMTVHKIELIIGDYVSFTNEKQGKDTLFDAEKLIQDQLKK
jgi:hypothetical protein